MGVPLITNRTLSSYSLRQDELLQLRPTVVLPIKVFVDEKEVYLLHFQYNTETLVREFQVEFG